MGICTLTIAEERDGWDVRFDKSIDVKGDRGEVVFCHKLSLRVPEASNAPKCRRSAR